MTFGSLFSGIGGIDLGLERAGMECRWQVEIDPWCRRVLAKHWPGVKRYEDVRDVGQDNLETVDLIAGGFPCQDVSVAGRREGLAGERSGLWFEFHRVLAETRPQWIVIENVPGLLSSHKGRDFATVLQGLVELGYGVAWRVLDAQHFGVAQRRRRVFIVGSLGDGRAAEVLLESDCLRRDSAKGREAGQEIAGTLGGSSQSGGFRTTDLDNSGAFVTATSFKPSHYTRGKDGAPAGIVPPLSADADKGDQEPVVLNLTQGETERRRIYDANGLAPNLASEQGRGHGVPVVFEPRYYTREEGGPPTDIVNSLKTHASGGLGDGEPVVFEPRYYTRDNKTGGAPSETAGITNAHKAGDSAPVVFEPRFARNGRGAPDGAQGQAVAIAENQRGELRTSRISAQITAGGGKPGQGYAAAHTPLGVRRLTPTECERLQGFPDGWTEGESDSARYRMLGNAVCVPVAEFIGRQILETR